MNILIFNFEGVLGITNIKYKKIDKFGKFLL